MTDIEKIYDILTQENVKESVINNLDYLLEIIPELKNMIGFPHNHPHHHLDVWEHTLYALSLSKNDFDVRLTLLLHDIGKPFSYQDEEVRHFHNHNLESEKMGRKILKRLNYKDDYIEKICFLIKNHDTEILDSDIEENIELSKTRFEVQTCDALAHHPEKLEKRIKYINLIKNKIKEKSH